VASCVAFWGAELGSLVVALLGVVGLGATGLADSGATQPL